MEVIIPHSPAQNKQGFLEFEVLRVGKMTAGFGGHATCDVRDDISTFLHARGAYVAAETVAPHTVATSCDPPGARGAGGEMVRWSAA